MSKHTLPDYNAQTQINNSPHIVILGAGASLAAFPHGDATGKKLPLMNNIIELTGLAKPLESNGFKTKGINFEALYDELATSGKMPNLVEEIQTTLHDYFSSMLLPEEPTIYDYLILSLREKDIIATFNWDPFLVQAIRRNMHIVKPPEVVFLHGNVEIGVCYNDRVRGLVWSAPL